MGIRQRVALFFSSAPNATGHTGLRSQTDVTVTNRRSPDYSGDVGRGKG